MEYYCPDRRGYKKLACQTRNQILADIVAVGGPARQEGERTLSDTGRLSG